VEENHYKGYVCSLMGTACHILAVIFSELGCVLWLPPVEENSMVD
jgi:hypothetical protein